MPGSLLPRDAIAYRSRSDTLGRFKPQPHSGRLDAGVERLLRRARSNIVWVDPGRTATGN
jgi:hypothetical protein